MNDKITSKVDSPKKSSNDSLPNFSQTNTNIEKILHNKYKINTIGKNSEKFENKMKVFRVLDSYVDIKDYMKKINLLYNPQMKEILENTKKRAFRKEFHQVFGVNINELERNRDFSQENHQESFVSRVRNTIKTQREQRYYNEESRENGDFLQDKLKSYLSDDFITNFSNFEQEKDSESQIFERINEFYAEKKPEEMLIKMKEIRKNSPNIAKRTKYEKDLEKYQSLIENSIDFNLIKHCKNDEEGVPSHFYSMAYEEHAKKVQNILKKTCMKLYNRKIYQGKEKNSKINEESEKIQRVLQKKGNYSRLNDKIYQEKKCDKSNDKFIDKNYDKFVDKNHNKFHHEFNDKNYQKKNNEKFEKKILQEKKCDKNEKNYEKNHVNNYQNEKLPCFKVDILPKINKNTGIKAKFANFMKKLNFSQIENEDKKLMILKEIDDIEDVIEKDLEQIKIRQLKRVESIRDCKVEVDKKARMIKSYLLNKKKGKYH